MSSKRVRNALAPVEAARYEVVTLQLRDGWSGKVLIDPRDSGDPGSASWTGESFESWRDVCSALVRDARALPECVVLKHSRTAMVMRARVRVGAGSASIVCKHSVATGFVRDLAWRVRGSRESRNMARGLALLRAHVDTAVPRAILERAGSRREAWLITEEVADAIDLDGVMSWHIYGLDRFRALAVKRALSEAAVELCKRMDDAGIRHRDFKASNILITDWLGEEGGPRLWLVDMDGISNRSWLRIDSGWRSIVRLAASLVDERSFTRGDAARFLKAYVRDRSDAGMVWKRHWRRLARDVACYNRHARLRKRGKLDGFTA